MPMNVNDAILEVQKNLDANNLFWKHKNLLLIGQNSAGKSKIIKQLIRNELKKDEPMIYFIDSRNRTIMNEEKESIAKFSSFTMKEILNARIDSKYFNKIDVFKDVSSGTEIVYSELSHCFEKYHELFKDLLNIDITKEDGEQIAGIETGVAKILVNKEYELEDISNGEAAMMRIIMEVENAYINACKLIIIDEFDAHIDNDNIVKLINSLKEKYSEMRFIIVLHDMNVVLQIEDFDVLTIKKAFGSVDDNECKYFDVNEISSVSDLHKAIRNIKRKKVANDILLEDLLTNIIENKVITSLALEKIMQMDESQLTTKQKVMLEYIVERVEK